MLHEYSKPRTGEGAETGWELDDCTAQEHLARPFRAWEPTPLDLGRAKLRTGTARQSEMPPKEYASVEPPAGVTEGLANYVDIIRFSRDAHRNTYNRQSYSSRTVELEDADDPVRYAELLDLAELGSATPAELLEFLTVAGLPSVELAKLTHPYADRIEFLPPMREEIARDILQRGGQLANMDTCVEYTPLGMDCGIGIDKSLGMKRLRVVGAIGLTTIYERSSFIVNIDGQSSQVDPAIAKHLRGLKFSRDCYPYGPWRDQVMAGGALEKEVIRLLEADDFASVIPLSTTVFARNSLNEGIVERRAQEAREASALDVGQRMPELLRIQQERHATVIRNLRGMALSNFSDEAIAALNIEDETPQ